MSFVARADAESAGFFEAAASDRLLLRECAACGQFSAPYGLGGGPSVCTNCNGAELRWTDARKTGTVVSWIVIHSKPAANTATEPNAVVIVELADGPWLIGPFVSDRSLLEMGLAVTVGFRRVGGGEPIPVFEALASVDEQQDTAG